MINILLTKDILGIIIKYILILYEIRLILKFIPNNAPKNEMAIRLSAFDILDK